MNRCQKIGSGLKKEKKKGERDKPGYCNNSWNNLIVKNFLRQMPVFLIGIQMLTLFGSSAIFIYLA